MTRTGQHQRRISAIHRLEASGALALGAMLLTVVIGTPAAQAQTYTVLYRFKGSPTDGVTPGFGRLIGDSAGNLYGTTQAGGASGAGIVYKLDKTGETVLYSFTGGADGGEPDEGLIRDSAGNLYGTTYSGGVSNAGVVFKLDTTGTETVLYSFTGGTDGSEPSGDLIQDSAGNLYGNASGGGASGAGVVFKLDTTGTETALYSFTGGADGASPDGGLSRDSAGNLYGTTYYGGASNKGVVFKLDATGTETVLYSFTGGADGGYPNGGLVRDSAGNLYGTTFSGGTSHGVVFKLDATGAETVLYTFKGQADGGAPAAGLIRDPAGSFYGTASRGGLNGVRFGNGVVFKLQP